MVQPTFKAPHQQNEIHSKHRHRDVRSSYRQLVDGLSSPIMLGGLIASAGIAPFIWPEAILFTSAFAWLIYHIRMRKAKKEHLPFRMPSTSFLTDYGDPSPGRRGFSKASGTFLLGNTFGEHTTELWMGIRDMLTHTLIFGTTGSGKAQPLTAKLLTPSGWRCMGDIKVGDLVISKDGETVQVLATYPQGTIAVYRIIFEDGRATEGCGDHLWETYRAAQEKSVVLSTNTIAELLLNETISIPLFAPKEYPEASLPIDPYVLGCLISLGEFTHNEVGLILSSENQLKIIQHRLPENLKIRKNEQSKSLVHWFYTENENLISCDVSQAVNELWVNCANAHERFIPDSYLEGSLQQRMDLIRGIMDSNGFAGELGKASFTTKSKEFAEQFQSLLWSIGAIASLSVKLPDHFSHNEIIRKWGTTYTVNLEYIKPSDLFYLEKKRKQCLDYKAGESLRLSIKEIQLIGEKESQCIFIDHPSHLYITDDYVVTHNTETLVSLSFNAIAMGSGLFYVDPKGSPKLIAQMYVMSRVCGRDDDFRCINYLTAEKSGVNSKMPLRTTHMINPFSYGNAESLSNMLNSLIPKSEGSNAIFSANARNLMKSVMYALVELRDVGEIQLSSKTIRDYLTLSKVMELAARDDFSRNTKDAIRAFLTSVGWQEGKAEREQPKSLPEQFGYARSYFGDPLNNLTDTYGHIYGTPFGEIDMRDVVMNRRILVIVIPSLAMAQEEVKSLGVISLSAIRIAIAVGLGTGKEGSFSDILYSLPTDAPAPFISITDEYAAIPTPGYVEVLTQGRGLGIAAIVASQDFAGIEKADKEGAQQLLENTKTKLFMKGTVKGSTYDILVGLVGEMSVMETTGFAIKPESTSMMMDYRDNLSTNVKERSKVHLADIQEQIEGEFHCVSGSKMVRGQTFYANPPLPADFQIQYSHMVAIYPPETRDLDIKFGATSRILEFLIAKYYKLPAIDSTLSEQVRITNKETEIINDFAERGASGFENEGDGFNAIFLETIANPLPSPMDTVIAAFMRFHLHINAEENPEQISLSDPSTLVSDSVLGDDFDDVLDSDNDDEYHSEMLDDHDSSETPYEESNDSDIFNDDGDNVEFDEEPFDNNDYERQTKAQNESVDKLKAIKQEIKNKDPDKYLKDDPFRDILPIEIEITGNVNQAIARSKSTSASIGRMKNNIAGDHPTDPVPLNDNDKKENLANRWQAMIREASVNKK